jgi:hypothetical protein
MTIVSFFLVFPPQGRSIAVQGLSTPNARRRCVRIHNILFDFRYSKIQYILSQVYTKINRFFQKIRKNKEEKQAKINEDQQRRDSFFKNDNK